MVRLTWLKRDDCIAGRREDARVGRRMRTHTSQLNLLYYGVDEIIIIIRNLYSAIMPLDGFSELLMRVNFVNCAAIKLIGLNL